MAEGSGPSGQVRLCMSTSLYLTATDVVITYCTACLFSEYNVLASDAQHTGINALCPKSLSVDQEV